MGFKQLSKKQNEQGIKPIIKSEDDFVNAARGETSLPKKTDKRNVQMQLYLNESEMATLKQTATHLGMKVTQYVRFKLFSENKVKAL